MFRSTLFIALAMVICVGPIPGQQGTGKNGPASRQSRDIEAGESSSRDTRIDLTPPKDDAKNHPESSVTGSGPDETGGVQELHPWDPHKAMKSIEVGDYYFKRKNYSAALDRYREAQVYKPNDAVSNFRIAQCLEKLDNRDEAIKHYEAYLKVLPNGPFSEDARKSLKRLGVKQNNQSDEKLQTDLK